MIKPLGFYVLVKVEEAEEITKGGIALPTDLVKKEQAATQIGKVLSFGPTAYVDWAGCKDPSRPSHEQWGINVGDRVEFQRFEGKASVVAGYDNHRFIPDTHIIGKIEEDSADV